MMAPSDDVFGMVQIVWIAFEVNGSPRKAPCVRIVVASNFQLEVAKNEQKIYKVI